VLGGLRGRTCPFTGNCERQLKGGSENGASHSMGVLLGNLQGGGGCFVGGPESYGRKALGMGISFYAGSVVQPGVGLSFGDFEIWLKGLLEVESLYVGAL
jgi:hypothetical protein